MPPSTEPEAKDAGDGSPGAGGGERADEGGVTGGKKVADEDEMSPEDRALQEGLELAVARTRDREVGVVRLALQHLRDEIRSATSSMTSVPKPLKFLRPHFAELKAVWAGMAEGDEEVRRDLADILAVLAMTMGAADERESLTFKLQGHTTDLGSWGHEFVRALAGEIGDEYTARTLAAASSAAGEGEGEGEGSEEAPADHADLMLLVDHIVPFHVQHHAEAEAVDLLIEVQQLGKLASVDAVDEKNFERICLYLLRCADFVPDPDDLSEVMAVAFQLYLKHGASCDALRVALRMDDLARVGEAMQACDDAVVKKQMCLVLARHRTNFEEEEDELNEIIGNTKLSGQFLNLARDLDVMEAKTPEDIYKSHLGDTGGFVRRRDTNAQVDSAQQNLADTFVNAFVNAGFGQDNLMTPKDSQWLYKNKEHRMLSAAASLGMVFLWDLEMGLVQLDKYLYTEEPHIKAGAVLGIGVVGSGIRDESDPLIALLPEYMESKATVVRCAACAAFGIAYAGSAREDVMEYLVPAAANTEDADMTEVALAALSLGQIFVGTCNEEIGSVLMQRLMEASDAELDHPMARFLCLALGLLFLGKMEKADAMLEAVKTVEHKAGQYAAVTLESCAYAGTGNVLKVQQMLHTCTEHLQENAEHQSVAVLGIAMLAMGEDVGTEMALRAFDHLLHYCELPIRRAVPLALALLHVSNPDFAIVDQMSRLSHDNDVEVAHGAIVGLGLVAAGTNNSRVAGLLRSLAEHSRDPAHLFIVRLAQGLLHMGKGLVSLNPFHSDRLLLSGVGMSGLLTVLHCCLDLKNTLLDKVHYMLFYLAPAMNPRMLVTVDEDFQPLPISVRVGQAVETVGQAGRPKSISGFQTHTTPVLLSVTERAELAAQEYLPASSMLEGIVILQKNPEWEGENAP